MHCLIVEDHPVTALGLGLIIKNNFPGWKSITAATVHEAIKCLQTSTHPPIDLMLLDLILPDENGTALLAYLQQEPSMLSVSTIIISSIGDKATMNLCKEYGARGYVPKSKGANQIILALKIVSSGGEYFFDEDETAFSSSNNRLKLSERQKDIVELVLAGYSNKKIAIALDLSEGTVKNYMFHLMRLMDVKSRLEMAMRIREKGYRPRDVAR